MHVLYTDKKGNVDKDKHLSRTFKGQTFKNQKWRACFQLRCKLDGSKWQLSEKCVCPTLLF